MTHRVIPYSEACERNKYPILDVIQPRLNEAKHVLEIGSGTGQHAVFFAKALSHLVWQSSDQAVYLDGLRAQLDNAALENTPPPLQIDVEQSSWLADDAQLYDAIFSANTLHIMSWSQVEAFFSGVSHVLGIDAQLMVYGPFKYQGKYTSESNARFDQLLQDRDPLSGIRDFEQVDQLAVKNGFSFLSDTSLPANNQCLIWRKIS